MIPNHQMLRRVVFKVFVLMVGTCQAMLSATNCTTMSSLNRIIVVAAPSSNHWLTASVGLHLIQAVLQAITQAIIMQQVYLYVPQEVFILNILVLIMVVIDSAFRPDFGLRQDFLLVMLNSDIYILPVPILMLHTMA